MVEKKRTEREPLSRQRILDAAVRLVDAEGIDVLTMRRLAGELNVEGASLYKHIPNKAALLFGMLQTIFLEMDPDYPQDPADWQGRLRAGMRAFRDLGLRHPQVFGLLNRPWNANIRRVETELTSMIDSGFTVQQASHAMRLLTSYTIGFVVWETSAQTRDPAEVRESEAELGQEHAPERYPNTQAARGYLATAGQMNEAFEFGLNAAIAGISRMVLGEGD